MKKISISFLANDRFIEVYYIGLIVFSSLISRQRSITTFGVLVSYMVIMAALSVIALLITHEFYGRATDWPDSVYLTLLLFGGSLFIIGFLDNLFFSVPMFAISMYVLSILVMSLLRLLNTD